MAAPQASSRLEMLQARFQQRQLIEKEQKLLQLYDQQQLRAHQVAQRGSAGSNCSNSSGHGSNGTTTHHQTVTRTSTTTQSTSNSQGGGKVRQMFDERRQTSVKGIDKSYPLEPLDNRSRKQQTTTGNVVVSSTSPTKNGNPMSNRQSVVTRRTARSEVNSNINGGKPIVSYHEEVTRESCGPTEGVNDPEEFGDENDEVSRYANGNPHIDQRSEVHIEDATNENTTQRHRTTAKIHLAGFDSDSGTNRVGDDLDNEQFPDVPVRSVPDRLPRRGPAAKKPSQAEARFERFKNTNTNRPPGKTTKQVAGNTTSFTKKRTETTTNSGSSSRVAKSPSPDIGTKRTTDHRRARTPTASVRRSVPSSPAKSPDATGRYGSAELKSTGSKLLSRPSTSPSSLREDGNRSGSSRTSVYSDFTDGPGNHFQSTVTESVFSVATKTHEAFVVELDDDGVSSGKDGVFPKPPLRKKSSDTSLTTSQKQQRSPTGTPLPRPTSALSIASSSGSARCQSKIGMATKTKSPTSTAPKVPPGSARVSAAAAVNDGLAACNICGRRFNSDRINLHEQICSKTATKKRKQFDATIHRVKGTELEPFVKKAGSKKPQADRKSQKPEVKSNWRRKHEDFINAIRSAKQVQAHLAAGGKLSDLPPPPASDTSDYVQCPHCGRKFNQGAAERHIPKCQNMLHNKPNPRAPPKPKR